MAKLSSNCSLTDLPDDVFCNITVYVDDTTLYSKCDQVSGSCLWQKQELDSELEYNHNKLGEEVTI